MSKKMMIGLVVVLALALAVPAMATDDSQYYCRDKNPILFKVTGCTKYIMCDYFPFVAQHVKITLGQQGLNQPAPSVKYSGYDGKFCITYIGRCLGPYFSETINWGVQADFRTAVVPLGVQRQASWSANPFCCCDCCTLYFPKTFYPVANICGF